MRMTVRPEIRDEAHAVKCELAAEVLRSSGSLRLKVTGWSMLPTVLPGDVLIIERAEAESVRVGDIVLVGRDGRLVAHRLVHKRSENAGVVTRGDAMDNADTETDESSLLGKVSLIIRGGRLIRPRRTLRFRDRAVAALVRKSETAARIVVGIHGMRNHPELQTN